MKVQDRETMEWVSWLVPEHISVLQETLDKYKEKPILDAQTMTKIDNKLKAALEQQTSLEMTYYQTGDIVTESSRLRKIDQQRGYIVLRGDDGLTISLHDIVDVELVS